MTRIRGRSRWSGSRCRQGQGQAKTEAVVEPRRPVESAVAAARICDEFAEETWSAFWRTMVEGHSCSDVAESMGKSLGAVYTARSSVMQRLKEEVNQFDWLSAEEDRQQANDENKESIGGES